MKVKTSITLSEDVFKAINCFIGPNGNRSRLVEEAVQKFLSENARKELNETDLSILNSQAAEFNREALDVLRYQVDL